MPQLSNAKRITKTRKNDSTKNEKMIDAVLALFRAFELSYFRVSLLAKIGVTDVQRIHDSAHHAVS